MTTPRLALPGTERVEDGDLVGDVNLVVRDLLNRLEQVVPLLQSGAASQRPDAVDTRRIFVARDDRSVSVDADGLRLLLAVLGQDADFDFLDVGERLALTKGSGYISSAYTQQAADAGLGYIRRYDGAGIRCDKEDGAGLWVNENYAGNNGWSLLTSDAGGVRRFYAETGSGNSQRTYTHAQLAARLLLTLTADGRLIVNRLVTPGVGANAFPGSPTHGEATHKYLFGADWLFRYREGGAPTRDGLYYGWQVDGAAPDALNVESAGVTVNSGATTDRCVWDVDVQGFYDVIAQVHLLGGSGSNNNQARLDINRFAGTSVAETQGNGVQSGPLGPFAGTELTLRRRVWCPSGGRIGLTVACTTGTIALDERSVTIKPAYLLSS